MQKILSQSFFDRSTLEVSSDLLGKYLVRRYGGKETALMITEVEAYDGPKDKACHAHRGKTGRNAVMFGPAGYWYVYFCYGVHWMLNIVTGEVGYPAAVLIRGVEGIRGPGKITKHLHIDKRLTNKQANRSSGLWIEDRGTQLQMFIIKRTPRIGVQYAGSWAKKPYRYLLS